MDAMSLRGASQQSNAMNRVASRIDTEIERIKTLTDIVNSSTSRITRHANALGFFEPPKAEPSIGGMTSTIAVSLSLSDALADLARAVDRNSGALNVFD